MTADSAPVPDASDPDVLIIGAGPVGLVTALLLARRGWQVTILERKPAPYPQPRAVHFDDEVARLLADAGIGDQLPRLSDTADIYEWRNGAGETLLRFDWAGTGPSGWPVASMFHQPDLEAALTDAAATAHIRVLRGWEAMQLIDTGDRVEVIARDSAGERHDLAAGWVVGCDGANSFVRTHMTTEVTDLGFFYDWLIVDVATNDQREWNPTNLQVCDPARPTTAVSGGPGRRRWEFMRMPGESVEDLNQETTAWQLLEGWGITADNSILERHALYTFQASWTDQWRSGRLLLAGDSAHLMPPFAGQGMCSGIRDAANLTWKLDLVLAGRADSGLLDSYGSERSAHVQHAIGMSVELGKVICVTDAEQAAQRDAFMIGNGADPARVLPPLPPSTLTDGVLYRDASGAVGPGAGVLTPQGRVSHHGRTGRLDQVVGLGFVLACVEDPQTMLSVEDRAFLDTLGVHVLHLVADSAASSTDDDAALDVDGVYLPHLVEAGHVAALVRPDHYLFGTAAGVADVAELVDQLRRQLGSSVRTAVTSGAVSGPGQP